MNARQGFVGQSVERREDTRFLTGRGQYTDDITLPGQTHGVFLRSPHAHASIKSNDTTAAAKAPGDDAIINGEVGQDLFRVLSTREVVPVAWGENGFSALSN